jgi:hypothetical protein
MGSLGKLFMRKLFFVETLLCGTAAGFATANAIVLQDVPLTPSTYTFSVTPQLPDFAVVTATLETLGTAFHLPDVFF